MDVLIAGALAGLLFGLIGFIVNFVGKKTKKVIHESKINRINKTIDENKMKDDTTQNVVVENKFSIELPLFLSPAWELGDTLLKYCNEEVEFYVTVNDELKTDLLAAMEKKKPFFDKDKPLLDNMVAKSLYKMFGKEEVAISNWQETEINGNKAITLIAQIRWEFMRKIEVYYKFGFIESKDKFYQIIVWTIIDIASIFDEKMSEIIKSFKEL
jgi:hypothetical protein